MTTYARLWKPLVFFSRPYTDTFPSQVTESQCSSVSQLLHAYQAFSYSSVSPVEADVYVLMLSVWSSASRKVIRTELTLCRSPLQRAGAEDKDGEQKVKKLGWDYLLCILHLHYIPVKIYLYFMFIKWEKIIYIYILQCENYSSSDLHCE